MKSNSRRNSRIVTFEILPSLLRMVLLEQRTSGETTVQIASLPWRQQASHLGAEGSQRELAAAIKQLAGKHRLGNTGVQVALGGDFCVTRVVSGLIDEVRRELAELEQRSSLYLSLGHGNKCVANCIVPIDARHQRAMLAVANERVLSAVAGAFDLAGLTLTVVEPALVSLCRLVGALGADQERPALVVHGNERGLELGISYGGQLLLDYRPAAQQAKEHAGNIIGSHLHRLQRYCDRYVRVGGGKLVDVFVSGEPALIEMVERDLQGHAGLVVHALAPAKESLSWQISDLERAPTFAAPLGVALLATENVGQHRYPNLLDRTQSRSRQALLPALTRTLWPLAAMLTISLLGASYLQWEYARFSHLEAELAVLAPLQQQARTLRSDAMQDQQELGALVQIRHGIASPPWNEIALRISQCLPDDVWLDDFRVDGQGRLQLAGASFTEDGVFEFVRWLEQFPELKHVALSGTRPTRLDVGPATQFDVRCDFAGGANAKEGDDDNG